MNSAGPFHRKGSGRPRSGDTLIGIRMAPDLLAALDRFVAEEAQGKARPEALCVAFRQWAEDRGYLARRPPDEGKRPSELNSDNDG